MKNNKIICKENDINQHSYKHEAKNLRIPFNDRTLGNSHTILNIQDNNFNFIEVTL